MNISADELIYYNIYYNQEDRILKFASEQLNKYLDKVLGVTLRCNGNSLRYISLGKTRYSEKDFPAREFCAVKPQHYAVFVSNGNILIEGDTSVDVLRGVYGFAENCLGVRFLSEDCEIVPKRTFLTTEDKYFESKAFSQFEYLSYSTSLSFEYCLKFGFSGSYSAESAEYGVKNQWFNEIPTSHNSHFYVDFNKYKKSNPEFFAVKGENSDRFEMNFDGVSSTELCYSNGLNSDGTIDNDKKDNLVNIVAESLFKYVAKAPEKRYFMFGRQDNRNAICHCRACSEKRKKYGGESGTMIIFLNAVIKLTEKKLQEANISRDFRVVTFAYQSTEIAPVKNGKPIDRLVIPDKRLYIRYALIDADYTYSFTDNRHNQKSIENLNNWMLLTKNLMIWDYHQCYTEYLWFFPNLNYYADNIRFFAKKGIVYLMNQGAFNTVFSWQGKIRAYIAKNLYRNPAADEKLLLKEFLFGYYGCAAESVFRFINFMEDFFAEKIKNNFKISIFGFSDNFLCGEEYPLSVLEKALYFLKNGMNEIQRSKITVGEKKIYEKRLKNVMLTPLRMIVRNVENYGEKGSVYEKEFFHIADEIGLDMIGESIPYGLSIILNSESLYKIVVPEFFTDDEMNCAKQLSEELYAISSVRIPIVDGNSVSPNYLEHVISIGKTMMFGEFFKNFDYKKYRNYIETRGKSLFVYSSEGYKGFSDLIMSYLKTGVTEKNKLDVTFPFMRKFEEK